MGILLFLFLASHVLVFCEESVFLCEGFVGNEPVEYDAALKCMKSLPFSEQRMKRTLNYFSKIAQQYVFRDLYTDVNFGIDLFDELKQLQEKRDYEYDFEFHVDLRDVVSKLRDAHFAYIIPRCYRFIFLQPFPILQVSNDELQITEFWEPNHLGMRIPEKFKELYPSRSDLYENRYKGSKILKINGEDPFDVLSRYADEDCSYSRDPSVCYNRVLKSEWFVRVSTRDKIPEDSFVSYTLETSRGGELEVDVPWLVIPTVNYTISGLSIENEIIELDSPMEYFCGYTDLKEEDSEEQEKSGALKDKKGDFMTLLGESLRSSIPPSSFNSFSQTGALSLEILEKILTNQYFQLLVMSDLEELVREQFHVFEMNRFLIMDNLDLTGRNLVSTQRSTYLSNEDTTSEPDPYEPVPKGYVHVELTGEKESNATHRYFRLYLKEDDTKRIALLKVISFMPDGFRAMLDEDMEFNQVEAILSVKIFYDQLVESFQKMNETKVDQIIVDVRGNTGGIGFFPMVLANFLSPYAPYSPSPVGDEIYNEANDYLHCPRDLAALFQFLNQDRKRVYQNWYSGGPYYHRGTETSKYTTLVHFNYDLFIIMTMILTRFDMDTFVEILNLNMTGGNTLESSPESLLMADGEDEEEMIQEIISPWRFSPKMFEPEDILILTDGTCGSACGHFLRLIQSNQLGRVVNQGGRGGEQSMDTASFVGATVLLDKLLVDYSTNPLRDCYVPKRLRIERPLTSAKITVSHHEFYLWKPLISTFELEKVDTGIPSEFISIPADFYIENNWNFGDDICSDPSLLRLFDQCSEWEIKRAFDEDGISEHCPPKHLPFEHAVFGYPCVNGRFSDHECVLRGCERGYYLSESKDKCIEMPKDDFLSFVFELSRRVFIHHLLLPFSTFSIIVCSICGCVCASVAFIILWVCRTTRRRKKMGKIRVEKYDSIVDSSDDMSIKETTTSSSEAIVSTTDTETSDSYEESSSLFSSEDVE